MTQECVDLFREMFSGIQRENSLDEWFSFLINVSSSKSTLKIFLYFCRHGASTAWILQNELDIPEATVYRALTKLKSLCIVVPAIKVSRRRNVRGGPRSTVWALENSSTDETVDALRLHHQMVSGDE